MAKKGKLTPMMIQFYSIKQNYKDCVLLFRMGDFYETFDEDAKIASKALDIVLTSRQGIPLAGIPYHALDTYLGKLVKKGFKVAICEQVEDPKLAKGLVKREVIRIVTPGTIMEDVLLDERANNYLSAIFKGKRRSGHTVYGLAAADVSTGDFYAIEFDNFQDLVSELSRISPAECLLPRELVQNRPLTEACGSIVVEDDDWGPEAGIETLKVHFGIQNLKPFGCEDRPFAATAAAMVLGYIKQNNMGEAHITGLRTESAGRTMTLDGSTLRNLEIVQSIRDGTTDGTLLEVLDKTVTPMGSRLLRRWLVQPLLDLSRIRARQGGVEVLTNDLILLGELKDVMKGFHDMERLMSRVMYGSANARNLIALKNSLKLVGALKGLLKDKSGDSTLLRDLADGLDELKELVGLMEQAIVDEPPVSIKEGGMIREGYSEELDRLNDGVRDAREWIAGLEGQERLRTGIKTLRVKFNKVFGYFIEVSRGQAKNVPEGYIRKQTLVNSERFITEELKKYEDMVLSADEKIKALELDLFNDIREQVAKRCGDILEDAKRVAELDVLRSLADIAVYNDYQRPEVTDGTELIIKDGRHAVIETKLRSGEFVPNDTMMDCDENQLVILTGPNMAGKSTYMRQVALIVLLAQMGSFIPAREATLGLVDKIFTRVGASDDLTRGQSTFMVEMVETATILHTSTRRSLILLDEIGRGTATFDGLSLAWSVAEHLHNDRKLGGKTIFATHYHQLTELSKVLPRAKNFQMPVKEQDDELVFLRKVIPGSVDKSYGIQVAKLAGLPHPVIDRAKEVLGSLEAEELIVLEEGDLPSPRVSKKKKGKRRIKVKGPPRPKMTQLVLFSESDVIRDEIDDLDLGNMTPLEAMNKLSELQQKVRDMKDGKDRQVERTGK
jgi:DNA mismatch repair protein MutS